jgi:hypothetical protein
MRFNPPSAIITVSRYLRYLLSFMERRNILELKDIYKIEKFTQDELDNVNLLIENGWVILQVGTDEHKYDRLGFPVGSETIFFVAADRPTFESFNLKLHQQQLDIKAAAQSLADSVTGGLESAKRLRDWGKSIKESQEDSGSYSTVISDDDLPF